jgi:hypothetical protein
MNHNLLSLPTVKFTIMLIENQFVCFIFLKYFKYFYFLKLIFLYFYIVFMCYVANDFLKIKKYYFNIFLNKNYFKK